MQLNYCMLSPMSNPFRSSSMQQGLVSAQGATSNQPVVATLSATNAELVAQLLSLKSTNARLTGRLGELAAAAAEGERVSRENADLRARLGVVPSHCGSISMPLSDSVLIQHAECSTQDNKCMVGGDNDRNGSNGGNEATACCRDNGPLGRGHAGSNCISMHACACTQQPVVCHGSGGTCIDEIVNAARQHAAAAVQDVLQSSACLQQDASSEGRSSQQVAGSSGTCSLAQPEVRSAVDVCAADPALWRDGWTQEPGAVAPAGSCARARKSGSQGKLSGASQLTLQRERWLTSTMHYTGDTFSLQSQEAVPWVQQSQVPQHHASRLSLPLADAQCHGCTQPSPRGVWVPRKAVAAARAFYRQYCCVERPAGTAVAQDQTCTGGGLASTSTSTSTSTSARATLPASYWGPDEVGPAVHQSGMLPMDSAGGLQPLLPWRSLEALVLLVVQVLDVHAHGRCTLKSSAHRATCPWCPLPSPPLVTSDCA
jgi:hypothetical protein